jgi:outer membrane protein assembly factor BamA
VVGLRVTFFITIIFCLSTLDLWAAHTPTAQILITAGNDDYTASINELIHEPCMLEAVTFESDVFFEQDEFTYLTDLKPGIHITQELLNAGIFHLLKKNKFETIVLTMHDGVVGKRMHIVFSGFWSLARLKLHGLMMGKDVYRHYYLIEPGEPFDEKKHTLSLQKIKEAFVADGYYNGSVESVLERDNENKTVTTHLTLDAGSPFHVGTINLIIRNSENNDALSESLRADLIKHFFKKIGKSRYTKKMLNKEMIAIKRHLAKKGFLHVHIELEERINYADKKVNLTLTFDVHRKKELIFVGNHFYSVDKLFDILLLFGQSTWMLPANVLKQEIERAYRVAGFWNVQIDAQEHADAYTFTINEGERSVVKAMQIKNNSVSSAEQLIRDHFSDFLNQKFYDETLLDQARESLLAWYVGQGFIQTTILHQEFVPIEGAAHQYQLILTLQEGPRSYIDSITVEGFPELADEGPILDFRQSTEPVPFVMDAVHAQKEWLLRILHEKGLKDVRVHPHISRNNELITIIWKVMSAKNQFGKTIVQGISPVPFKYLLRELYYKEGDVWDRDKLKDSQLRLKGLEVFESVHLHPCNMSHNNLPQPVLLKVHKDDRFEIRTRTGFAVQQVNKFLNTAGLTYRLGGAFIIKNPFQCADHICFDLDVDRSQRACAVQYWRPWLFDMPIETTIKGYDNAYQQPGLVGCKKNLYQVFQQGFIVGLLRSYSVCDVGLNTGIELMKTTLCEPDATCCVPLCDRLALAINFEPSLLNKKIPYVQIEPTLLVDRLDKQLNPTKGTFSLLSLKGMFPFGPVGGDTYFVRLTAEHSFFYAIKHVVVALRLRLGHIFHRLLRNIMPTERFYLGGANSIRSYETDRCPPLGIFFDDQACPQYVPQGGKTMVNGNIEARIPLVKNFGLVLFQDIGALSGDYFADFYTRPLLAGTGFGVRYITPIGPVRFDFAWKWRKSYPSELPYAWFLSIGHAF